MKRKILIKSNALGHAMMALTVMVAGVLAIQEHRMGRALNDRSEVEIVSKLGEVASNQASLCYFAFFQKNSPSSFIVNLAYDHALIYHDRIIFQTLKNQKLIVLTTATKKSLLFYASHFSSYSEEHEIIS